jgi:tyrosine-protein phosphatase SIW14
MTIIKSTIPCVVLLVLLSCHIIAQETQGGRHAEWAHKDTLCDLKNLYCLNDEVYRSEQPDKEEFGCLEIDGIKSVLNLRKRNTDGLRAENIDIELFQVRMRAGSFTTLEVIEALRIIKTAPKPILIHCMHGSDRTGLICAMYRIVFLDWPKEKAIDELENGGYGFHKKFKNIPEYIRHADIESIRKETGPF